MPTQTFVGPTFDVGVSASQVKWAIRVLWVRSPVAVGQYAEAQLYLRNLGTVVASTTVSGVIMLGTTVEGHFGSTTVSAAPGFEAPAAMMSLGPMAAMFAGQLLTATFVASGASPISAQFQVVAA